jgi:hypothetical protein
LSFVCELHVNWEFCVKILFSLFKVELSEERNLIIHAAYGGCFPSVYCTCLCMCQMLKQSGKSLKIKGAKLYFFI